VVTWELLGSQYIYVYVYVYAMRRWAKHLNTGAVTQLRLDILMASGKPSTWFPLERTVQNGLRLLNSLKHVMFAHIIYIYIYIYIYNLYCP